MKMIDYLKRGGVQLCLLLLISVSITAQVRKKRPVVKRTATTQAVRKADLVYFDLKGKAHTCIVWSNAGGERDKRIFDANGKWIGYEDDAGYNTWNTISGILRDAKGRIVQYKENNEYFNRTVNITYEYSGNHVETVESVYATGAKERLKSNYDYRGVPSIILSTYEEGDNRELTIYYCRDYRFDSHGNWTSCTRKFDMEGETHYESISRIITYYK